MRKYKIEQNDKPKKMYNYRRLENSKDTFFLNCANIDSRWRQVM